MKRARHPKPAVEAALQDAKKHGWRVEPRPDHHGHAWGVIRCPEASPGRVPAVHQLHTPVAGQRSETDPPMAGPLRPRSR